MGTRKEIGDTNINEGVIRSSLVSNMQSCLNEARRLYRDSNPWSFFGINDDGSLYCIQGYDKAYEKYKEALERFNNAMKDFDLFESERDKYIEKIMNGDS